MTSVKQALRPPKELDADIGVARKKICKLLESCDERTILQLTRIVKLLLAKNSPSRNK